MEFVDQLKTVKMLAQRIYVRYVGLEALETPTMQKMLNVADLIVRLKPSKLINSDDLKPPALSVI